MIDCTRFCTELWNVPVNWTVFEKKKWFKENPNYTNFCRDTCFKRVTMIAVLAASVFGSIQSFIWRNIQIGPLFWNVFLGKYLKFNLHYTKIKTVYIMRRKQFYNVIIISWAHNRTLPLTCKYNCASKVWIGIT